MTMLANDARSAYRQSTARGASPLRLVVLLYEQAVQDLRSARAALDRHDIESRTRSMNHALLIIGQLQATLDLARGGEVAQNLARFYHALRAALIEAQAAASAAILDQQISNLLSLREAWLEVERSVSPVRIAATAPAPSPALEGEDWKA
jgi:flagellar protein FliS